MNSGRVSDIGGEAGSVSLEQVVLVATVAIVFAAALVPLGTTLFNYYKTIEFILALPIP